MKSHLPRITPLALAVFALIAFGAVSVLAANSLDNSYSKSEETFLGNFGAGKTVMPTYDPSRTPVPGEEFFIKGKVVSITATELVVDSIHFTLDAKTRIETLPVVGDLVKVDAVTQPDGSLLAKSVDLVSLTEETEEPSRTPHVTGTPESSRTPHATRTPDPNRTPGDDHSMEFEYKGAVVSMSPTAWVIGTFTFSVDAKTEISKNLMVGDMVQVEAVKLVDGTYLAREIDAIGKPEGTPKASPTPGPSATPKPSKTPGSHEEVTFSGTVMSMGADSWTVGATTFSVDSHTEVEGHPQVGDMVKVEAVKQADGSLLAKEIERTGQDEQGGGDDHDGDKDEGGGMHPSPTPGPVVSSTPGPVSSATPHSGDEDHKRRP